MSGHCKLLRPSFGTFVSVVQRKLSRSPREQRLESFDETFIRELENLKPIGGDQGILHLEWLQGALSLALKVHEEAVELAPNLDFPHSAVGEKWSSEYLAATTSILKVCNMLTASISSLEHGHLIARHAVYTLENLGRLPAETDLLRARESLQGCIGDDSQYSQCPYLVTSTDAHENLNGLLQGLLDSLKVPIKEKVGGRKGNDFLNALGRARVAAIVACTVLAVALSGNTENVPRLRFGVGGSNVCQKVIERAREEACARLARGCNGCVGEMEDVEAAVELVLKESRADEAVFRGALREARAQLQVLTTRLQALRCTLHEFLRCIVASRSMLLHILAFQLSD